MKRTYFLLAACLLLSGVLFAVATNWFGRAPEYVAAAGTRYTRQRAACRSARGAGDFR